MGMGNFVGHGWYMVLWWLAVAVLAIGGIWWLVQWNARRPPR